MSETQLQPLSYEEMIRAGMHFGRKKSIFHPNMKPFIYTLKENIYIIDLLKTELSIAAAVEAMKKVLESNGLILFVGLTTQSVDAVKKIAQDLKMPYVLNRWLGGTFTNFKTIISRVKYLEKLEQEKLSGGFEKYTKHERLMKDREIEKLKEKFDGLRSLTKVPDMVFVSSVKKTGLAIREARKTGVKIVGIINTDSDPLKIDYPIPANDNARKSVELIVNMIRDGLVISENK